MGIEIPSTRAHADLLLRISDVSVKFSITGSEVTALDHVSLDVGSSGYTVGVVGESGSGKSTLGMTMMNLIEPPGHIRGGRVVYGGKDVLTMSESELRNYRWAEVSMVHQSAMNSLNPVKPVCDPIVEVIREHLGDTKQAATAKAIELLAEVGIDQERAYDFPHEFSGGMRQRVVIALALALSPKLVIADEPTSALDVVVQRQILSLLRDQVSGKGHSMVFITHEISLLAGLVDDVVVMYSGEVVELGPNPEVLERPLHPYTESLVGALLTMETPKEVVGRHVREGAKEGFEAVPAGACKFSNRCKYAFDRCRKERPALREIEKGRWAACHKF